MHKAAKINAQKWRRKKMGGGGGGKRSWISKRLLKRKCRCNGENSKPKGGERGGENRLGDGWEGCCGWVPWILKCTHNFSCLHFQTHFNRAFSLLECSALKMRKIVEIINHSKLQNPPRGTPSLVFPLPASLSLPSAGSEHPYWKFWNCLIENCNKAETEAFLCRKSAIKVFELLIRINTENLLFGRNFVLCNNINYYKVTALQGFSTNEKVKTSLTLSQNATLH